MSTVYEIGILAGNYMYLTVYLVCNYLGACYVKLNRLSEAEEALFECLRLCKAIKRPGDPFTSGSKI